jgi:hypothetical protein
MKSSLYGEAEALKPEIGKTEWARFDQRRNGYCHPVVLKKQFTYLFASTLAGAAVQYALHDFGLGWSFLAVMVLGFWCHFTAKKLTTWISGPVVRMKEHMQTQVDAAEQSEFRLRKSDPFQEVVATYNALIKKLPSQKTAVRLATVQELKKSA